MACRLSAWAFLALIASNGSAFAWGYQGHEVIGSIADQLLGEHAKQQVEQILGLELRGLRVAGPWADCVKSVQPQLDGTFKYTHHPIYGIPCPPFETAAETARMEDYVARNWDNCTHVPKHGCDESYHFADVAIQHDDYERAYAGASEHDIVSAINAAILVLMDKPAPTPFSIRDKKEALLLLAHFVGDLHQPLHVGAIYLDPHGRAVNPDLGSQEDPVTETEGGNLISDQDHNFHCEWDAIPLDLERDPDLRANAAMVQKAQAVVPTGGQPENFAAIWASDTVVASHIAFAGLTFTGLTPTLAPTGNAFSSDASTSDSCPTSPRSRWTVNFNDPDGYLTAQDSLKRDQIAKAGARLAQLLNAIWP